MGFSIRRYLLAVLSHRELGIGQMDWKYLRFSHAQYGEDIIIEALLAKPQGFYVDVGAYDPVVISNTYLFYRKGWRGIAIDANPEVVKLFKRKRPRDIVLHCAVAEEEGAAIFHITKAGPTAHLGGAGIEGSSADKLSRTVSVNRRRLDSILKEHLLPSQEIDFMSVDCEGLDLSVLRSNDWQKHRPRVLAVEDFRPESESEICRFLFPLGYRLVLTAGVTRIFSR
jgi:FkbM family methyltransferase